MEVDQERYGHEKQEGVYRGLRWFAECNFRRRNSLDGNNNNNNERSGDSHWCGYVDFEERAPTERERELFGTVKELTYDENNVLGFDCAHCNDYPSGFRKEATYKDFPYVKAKLFQIIDAIKDGEK